MTEHDDDITLDTTDVDGSHDDDRGDLGRYGADGRYSDELDGTGGPSEVPIDSAPTGPLPYDLCPCTVERDHGATGELPGADRWAPNGSLTINLEGEVIDLGLPTLDMDGDGTNDTALVPGADGSQILVVDMTGEGAADGMLVLDGAGNVLVGFEIDAFGNPVQVDIPPGMNLAELVSGQQAGEGLAPAPAVPQGDPGAMSDRDGGQGANVVLELAPGQLVDLGPATLDLDGDGILESTVVPDSNGHPTWIVSELRPDGSLDAILTLDPETFEVVQEQFLEHGAEIDPATVVEPSGPPASPEQLVAPGIDHPNPQVALVASISQGMYDVASQVWFDLTGGEPYPRSDDGTPVTPGTAFAMLADMPHTSPETEAALTQLIDHYEQSLRWITA